MDSNVLRLILLLLGIALITGIYLWDKRKHVDSRLFKKRSARNSKKHDSSLFQLDDVEQQGNSESLDVAVFQKHEATAEPHLDESFEPAQDMHSIGEDLSFSARSAFQEFEAGADLPTKIIQVNVVARNAEISGQMILDLAAELNLGLGEFNIFHRMDSRSGKSVFSMANVVEPGTFDLSAMNSFKTPGLSLFSQLPAPLDCLSVYSEMMNVAKRISYIVGAELQDSSHSVLTSQSIEHERDAIVEYKQRLTLAMQGKS